MITITKVLEVPKGSFEYSIHCHSAIEFNCFLSGHGKYSVAGSEYPINQDDIFVFCNNTIHKITDIDNSVDMHILKLHFDPPVLIETPRLSGFDEILYGGSGFIRIPSGTPASDKIRAILYDMLAESEVEEDEHRPEMMLSYLFELLVTLERHVRNDGSATRHQFHSGNYKMIAATIEYINSNLNQELNICELARMAHVSKNSYLLWFKRYNGVSPYSYIQSKRIMKALELLKNSDRLITYIAYECGYNSTVSFNKAFRKVMGVTPTEFRKFGVRQTEPNC